MNVTQTLDTHTGHIFNPSKVTVLATSSATRNWISNQYASSTRPMVIRDTTSLGAHISIKLSPSYSKGNGRIAAALLDLHRIAVTPADRASKRHMIQAKPIPKAIYGSAITLLNKTKANKATSKALNISWGTTFALRSRELIFTTVLPAHRAHF